MYHGKYVLLLPGTGQFYYFQSIKDAIKMVELYRNQNQYTVLYQLVMEGGELVDAKGTKI